MKLFKIQILIALLAIPLMSCDNEIVPPATEQEIILEISRTWNCDLMEDDSPYGSFSVVISNNTSSDAKINISNFHNSGETITATVGKDLIIHFDYDIGNQVFKGKGEISNDYSRISWDYTVDNSSDDLIIVTGTSTYGGAA